jgi:hypothetical protein
VDHVPAGVDLEAVDEGAPLRSEGRELEVFGEVRHRGEAEMATIAVTTVTAGSA